MAEAGSKKNPYGVDSDPMRGKRNPYQSGGAAPSKSIGQKQRESIVDEAEQPDPVGDFVRKITGANKERKKSGY